MSPKTNLSRRAFLRGTGTVMALPFLECMWPGFAYADEPPVATLPHRFLAFYVPNGMVMPAWTPEGTGTDFTLGSVMAPLLPYKNDILVLTGVNNPPAVPDGAGDHAAGTASFLTATHVFKTEGANIQNGISVDQMLANHIGNQTSFPSLELGTEGGGGTGDCDSGYSCSYTRNISWAGPQTPVPKEVNPAAVFDRLFAGYDSQMTEEQIARRRLFKLSIVDFVREDAQRLNDRLGHTDRMKLDEYLTGINELEKRINEIGSEQDCYPGPRPSLPSDVTHHVRTMIDLLVLAFQCDRTRVASFMFGNAGSDRVYSHLGLSEGHHYLSHHEGSADKIAKLELINIWEMEQVAYLLERMSSIAEPDGSLLDHSTVLFSSECADGNSHSHYDMPLLLAGSGRGTISPGRHIEYTNDPTYGDLYLRILQNFGMDVSSFGDDGTTPISGLDG